MSHPDSATDRPCGRKVKRERRLTVPKAVRIRKGSYGGKRWVLREDRKDKRVGERRTESGRVPDGRS